MNITIMRTFFMWCTILNGALLAFSFLIFASAGDSVYQMHSKWYPMPREALNVAIYSLMGLFKILFIVLNLIPFIVLLIME